MQIIRLDWFGLKTYILSKHYRRGRSFFLPHNYEEKNVPISVLGTQTETQCLCLGRNHICLIKPFVNRFWIGEGADLEGC